MKYVIPDLFINLFVSRKARKDMVISMANVKNFGIRTLRVFSDGRRLEMGFIVGAPSASAAVYNLSQWWSKRVGGGQKGHAIEVRLWAAYKRGGVTVKELATTELKAREVCESYKAHISPDGEVKMEVSYTPGQTVKSEPEVKESPKKVETPVAEEKPEKKVRKPRRDKGIARGARRKTEVVAVEETDDDCPF